MSMVSQNATSQRPVAWKHRRCRSPIEPTPMTRMRRLFELMTGSISDERTAIQGFMLEPAPSFERANEENALGDGDRGDDLLSHGIHAEEFAAEAGSSAGAVRPFIRRLRVIPSIKATNGALSRGARRRKVPSEMETEIKDPPIVEKTKELCATLLEQPEVKTICEDMNAFLANEELRSRFDVLTMQGEALGQRQQLGLEIEPEEFEKFEKERDEWMANELSQKFLEAQKRMQGLQDQIHQYVSKTFELGRVPEVHDIDYHCNDCDCGG